LFETCCHCCCRDGILTLRKAKTGSSKLVFLTLINSSGQPDWRLQLLGRYQLKQVFISVLLHSCIQHSTQTSLQEQCHFSALTQPVCLDRVPACLHCACCHAAVVQQGSEVQALLTRITAGATLVAGYSGSKLHIPGLSVHDMSLDEERHKSKTIYLGSYSSSSSRGFGRCSDVTEIKVSVSRVSSADGSGEGWEVAGTSSQVNALL
jgi:hypothetical protein